MSTQNKPWYKQWWGVILAILIWPLFLLWFTWSRSKKNTSIKVLSTCGVLVLLLVFIAALSGSNKPTTSLANLNSQADSILTAATKNTEQLMSTGQADATQSNALSTSPQSAFEKWRSTVEKTTDSNTDNAYKQAAALYTSAGKTTPSALTAWKKDNFATYADIGVWQLAEVTVLVDNDGGSSSSSVQSDKTTLNTDYQAYQADLTKALTDISKLSGKPVATVPSASTPTTASTASTQLTESLASLNAQAVADFNPVLNDLTQQMLQGQSYATQSNAADAGSAFHKWQQAEDDNQNVANGKEVTAAYNKADNAFYAAHQIAPDALNNWNTDTGTVVSDITQWADAEWNLVVDQLMGSSTSNDQQTVNQDMQNYQSDLAKAQTDVRQL